MRLSGVSSYSPSFRLSFALGENKNAELAVPSITLSHQQPIFLLLASSPPPLGAAAVPTALSAAAPGTINVKYYCNISRGTSTHYWFKFLAGMKKIQLSSRSPPSHFYGFPPQPHKISQGVGTEQQGLSREGENRIDAPASTKQEVFSEENPWSGSSSKSLLLTQGSALQVTYESQATLDYLKTGSFPTGFPMIKRTEL